MNKQIKLLLIKIGLSLGTVLFSIFLVQKVIEKMGDDFAKTTKHVQEKAKADVAKATKQAEANQAQIEIEKNAAEKEARQLELKQAKEEIAEHKAEDSKKAEFESQFKPRPECNDPNIEWSKFVECKNEKITAKEAFYKSH